MGNKNAAPEDFDYSTYLDKKPTDLQERFALWIVEQTGLDVTALKSKQVAFEEGVRLGVALRMKFQASPENQEALEAQRQAVEDAKAAKAEKRASEKASKKAAKESDEDGEESAKPAKKSSKKVDPEPEPEDDDTDESDTDEADEPEEVEEAPKPAPARGRRPAKRAKANSAEAPF